MLGLLRSRGGTDLRVRRQHSRVNKGVMSFIRGNLFLVSPIGTPSFFVTDPFSFSLKDPFSVQDIE